MNRRLGKDTPVLQWLLEVAGEQKLYIVLLTLVQTVIGASVVGYALFLRGLIDGAVAQDREVFLRYAAVLILLVLFLILLRCVKRYLDEFCRSTLENRFKKRFFGLLLHKDYGQITAVHSAEWMNRLTSDAKVVADGMAQVLPNLCEMTARLLAAVTALLLLQPHFSFVIVPGGILMIILTFLFRTKLKALHKRIQERDGDLRTFYQERLNSQMVIRVFSKEEQTESEQDVYLEDHRSARMRRNRFSNLCNAGFSLIMNGAYAFGAIYCGLGILYGTMTYGTFTAVLQLVSQVQTPFANLSGIFPRYFAMIASGERLMEAESYEEDAPGQNCSEPHGDAEFTELGLQDVRFSYRQYGEGQDQAETLVLEHFNVRIRKGEFIVFSGPSGCGKSTVLKVLMSLFPIQSGRRYLKTQEDDRELTARDRALFSYVPQGNMLMQGTIRQIVAFCSEKAMEQEERIRQALKDACAEEFVLQMEKGIDTELGEKGAGLSEGQIQRLSIARALFAGRPILLLDEATSALDAETEERVLQNIRRIPEQTVIAVTHRPAAHRMADRVIEF